jgi:hypothetical protein
LISSNFNPTPFLVVGIVKKDGTGEVTEVIPDATSLLNAWHTYVISIRPDGHVEFYVDGALLYATSGKVDRSLGKLPLLFGDRSFPGPVRIDNVNVYHHEKEDYDRDDDKEDHHHKHRT